MANIASVFVFSLTICPFKFCSASFAELFISKTSDITINEKLIYGNSSNPFVEVKSANATG